MPNLSSLVSQSSRLVTTNSEVTLTNKTLTDPIIQYVAGDTSFTVPAGTTGERPSSPGIGELRFNTDEGSLEQYDGTNWGAVVPDDLDINTLSINGTQVVDSTGNVDTGSISINGTLLTDGESIRVPSGTTGERPASPVTGELRFNTDDGSFEKYDGTSWASLVPSDIDVNTLSINGTQVIDSLSNLTNIGTIKGINYPSTDGSAGQVLKTDGSGNLSFTDAGGGAWEVIADQTVSSGTSTYDFTGLGAYDIIRVIVVHRNTSGGAIAEITAGLSTGSSAQNPREDDYKSMYFRGEDGQSQVRPSASTKAAIRPYTEGDANKTFTLDATIYSFGQDEYTAYSATSNHWQSPGYASVLNGYIDHKEPYDYVRVVINNVSTTVGSKIYVLGAGA